MLRARRCLSSERRRVGGLVCPASPGADDLLVVARVSGEGPRPPALLTITRAAWRTTNSQHCGASPNVTNGRRLNGGRRVDCCRCGRALTSNGRGSRLAVGLGLRAETC